MNIYKVREDLEGNGEASDFWNISEELRTAEVGKVLKYHLFRKPPISTKRLQGVGVAVCARSEEDLRH